MFKSLSSPQKTIEILSHVDTLNSSQYSLVSTVSDSQGKNIYNYRISFNVDIGEAILNRLYELEIELNPQRTYVDINIFSEEEIKRFQRYDGAAFLQTLARRPRQIKRELYSSEMKRENNISTFSLVPLLADIPISLFRSTRDNRIFGKKKIWKMFNARDIDSSGLTVALDQVPAPMPNILKKYINNSKSGGSFSEAYFSLIQMGKDPASGIFGRVGMQNTVSGPGYTPQSIIPGALSPERNNLISKRENVKQMIYADPNHDPESCDSGNSFNKFRETRDPTVFKKNYQRSTENSFGGQEVNGSFQKFNLSGNKGISNGITSAADLQGCRLFLSDSNLTFQDRVAATMTGKITKMMSQLGENTSCPPNMSDQIVDVSNRFARRVEASNSIRTLSLIVPIHESMISAGSIDLQVRSVSPGGMLNQSLSFKLQTSDLDIQKSIPNVIPQAKIATSIRGRKTSYTLSLPDTNDCVVGYAVFKRSLVETVPVEATQFVEIYRDTPGPQKCVFIDGGFGGSRSVNIFRALPILASGHILSNFTSCQASDISFSSACVSMSCKSTRNGIMISSAVSFFGVEVIYILKRRVGERVWKEFPVRNNNSSLLDRDVIEHLSYEYSAKIKTKAGTVVRSSTFVRHYHVRPAGLVKTKVSNLSSTRSGVTFQLMGSMRPTDFSKIAVALQMRGISSLYIERIKRDRSLLQDLIFYKVERQDLLTSKIEYLGCYSSAEVIDESRSYASLRVPGRTYRYTARAVLVSPSDALDSVFNDPRSGQMVNPKNPQTIKAYRNTVELSDNSYDNTSVNVNTYDRVLSPRGLQTGVMPTGRFGNPESVFQNLTGDFAEFDDVLDGGSSIYRNVNNPISINFDGSILVKWNCGNYNMKTIDFFTVSAHSQGVTTVVGAAHPLESEGGDVFFLDTKFSNFVGEIEYSVVAVSLGGSVGKSHTIGKIIKGEI